MKITHVRGLLLVIFIIFFMVAAVSIVVPFIKGEVYSDSMSSMLTKLLIVYSVPLSLIIGTIFGQRISHLKSTSKTVLWSAVLLAVIWNIFVIWRIVWFACVYDDTVDTLIAYFERVVPSIHFLVVGMLGYFFAKR